MSEILTRSKQHYKAVSTFKNFGECQYTHLSS